MKRRSVSWVRLLDEAMAGVVQRSSRSPLTILGTALGVASFIAVLGVTASANSQISSDFLHSDATQIVVTSTTLSAEAAFPPSADSDVRRMDGVSAVAHSWIVSSTQVSGLAASIAAPPASQPQVLAATPGYWELVRPRLRTGRTFDAFLADQPVAVIGTRIAKDLGIEDLRSQPAIIVNGNRLLVIGIVADTRGSSAAITSVVVPADYARKAFPPPGIDEQMIVDTRVGATAVVAEAIAWAIDPASPSTYRVVPPPPPAIIRERVDASTQRLFFSLAGISMVVSGVGIANASLIGVLARAREIALRRSLGALPRHIAAQFLLESSVRGLLGGLIGTILGVLTITGTALVLSWTAVVEPWSLIAGPIAGFAIGASAGVYPAIRATHIRPIDAFHH